MLNFKINYTGSSKLLRRICEKLNEVPILGTNHEDAFYGDQGEAAWEHSRTTGNPHGLTLQDLGIEKIKDEMQLLMEAIGGRVVWTRHSGSEITTHDGDPIYFQVTARVLEWH